MPAEEEKYEHANYSIVITPQLLVTVHLLSFVDQREGISVRIVLDVAIEVDAAVRTL